MNGPRRPAVHRAATISMFAVAVGIVSVAAPPLPLTMTNAMERVRISADGRSFVLHPSDRRFRPWGFNYDHDRDGRLLEQYWESEWETVEQDFREMRNLGANVVRIHLQFNRFMDTPERPNARALERLERLLQLAERTGLYLDLTGLGCYRRDEVPSWYDELEEPARWQAQAAFWRAVARVGRTSRAVFCYDLMNEPIIGGGTNRTDWLAGELAGLWFVQRIALDLRGRSRDEVATAWVQLLVSAIRSEDSAALITVGEIPWAMVWPNARSVFHLPATSNLLDFVSIHVYPRRGELERATHAVRVHAAGKPVVVEEIFPLECDVEELEHWMRSVREDVAGWIGFYWGATPEELRATQTSISNALTLNWLQFFQRAAPEFAEPWPPATFAADSPP